MNPNRSCRTPSYRFRFFFFLSRRSFFRLLLYVFLDGLGVLFPDSFRAVWFLIASKYNWRSCKSTLAIFTVNWSPSRYRLPSLNPTDHLTASFIAILVFRQGRDRDETVNRQLDAPGMNPIGEDTADHSFHRFADVLLQEVQELQFGQFAFRRQRRCVLDHCNDGPV